MSLYLTAITTVTSNYSATANDRIILMEASSGGITIELPAVHKKGRVYEAKDKLGAATTFTLKVVTADSDTIDGASEYTLTTDFQSARFVSDGDNWYVL